MIGFVKKGSKYVFVANNPKKAVDALAAYIVAKIAKDYEDEPVKSWHHPFYWQNGNKTRSHNETNKIIKDVGIVAFCLSFFNNTGGCDWKYGQSMIYVMLNQDQADNYEVSYILQEHVDVLIKHKWTGVLETTAPFQECGEEETDNYTFVNGEITHTIQLWSDM